jgi:hypothetical protein
LQALPLDKWADEPRGWRLITIEPEVVGRVLILHVGPDFLNLAVTDIVDEHSAVLVLAAVIRPSDKPSSDIDKISY